MGKITVKHYLNTNLKPRTQGKYKLYPIYVQVIISRLNFRFKSPCLEWFNDGYLKASALENEIIIDELNNEKAALIRIYTYLESRHDLKEFPQSLIIKYLKPLNEILNDKYMELLESEYKKIEFPNNVKSVYPELFIDTDFNKINEVLYFTKSSIEKEFTEYYQYCKYGIEANLGFTDIPFDIDKKYVKSGNQRLIFFDYIHDNGIETVKNNVIKYLEYRKMLTENNIFRTLKALDELIDIEGILGI